MTVQSEGVTGHPSVSQPEMVVGRWTDAFNKGLSDGDAEQLSAMFLPDSHWRDVAGLGGGIATISGPHHFASRLMECARAVGAGNFRIAMDRVVPAAGTFAGEDFIEALLHFDTVHTAGIAHVRLKADADGAMPRAWTLMTAIDTIKGHDLKSEKLARDGSAFERDWSGPGWADCRTLDASFADHDPAVLVIGGGHGGLTVAAWLKALNIDTLVVDRHERIGDSWRKRYHALKTHSVTDSMHLPFMPFPPTWPKYIPKDKIANWFECYVEAMEIDYWANTSFEGADYDEARGRWNARLKLADGSIREMHPDHIIMATSQIGIPHVPDIPTIERFAGTVVHSSQFTQGSDWSGKNVFVFGTGTSAHDLTQELHAHGANVTMVQRGETEVLQVEPTSHMYLDVLYQGDGPPLETRDVLAMSVPIPVMKAGHQQLTKIARVQDSELLDGLKRVGFRLESDENSYGWVMKYFTRGGGYYFNVGGSDLLIRGEAGLLQYAHIGAFEAGGIRLSDGRLLNADLIVLATGYKGYDDLIRQLFGEDVAERIGPVWGMDSRRQELGNMWIETVQPGLWFAGGSFAHSRIYGKIIALQIKLKQLGAAVQ